MAKLRCPRCKSLDVEVVAAPEKKFSLGKAAVGTLFLGPLGTVAGGCILGKRGKATVRCQDCGTVFERKL